SACHQGRAPAPAVDDHAQIEFARDVTAPFDEHAPHGASRWTGLVGNEILPEQLPSKVLHLIWSAADLDAARFAAPAGMDLRLDDAEASETAGDSCRLLCGRGHATFGNRDAETPQHVLCLKLMNVHPPLRVLSHLPHPAPPPSNPRLF